MPKYIEFKKHPSGQWTKTSIYSSRFSTTIIVSEKNKRHIEIIQEDLRNNSQLNLIFYRLEDDYVIVHSLSLPESFCVHHQKRNLCKRN